jgi:SAM-dependent methyltransferase
VVGPAREAAKARAQAAIDEATRDYASGAIAEETWQQRVSAALAAAYLGEDDPRWQSGFDGDADLWREARALILDAIPRNGSFLDVGCANGHLLESIATWAAERGLELTLYGLELDADLADAARRRLPALATRIHTGNVSDWPPPRRFTYVRTGLEYVAAGREAALIERLFRDVVADDGRLIVGPVAGDGLEATLGAFDSAGISEPTIVSATDRNGKTRYVVWVSTARRHSGPAVNARETKR